jgi:hypothetical protein
VLGLYGLVISLCNVDLNGHQMHVFHGLIIKMGSWLELRGVFSLARAFDLLALLELAYWLVVFWLINL